MTLTISQHPSGGFILNIPIIQQMVIRTFEPFKTWNNGNSIPLTVEMEFSREPFNRDLDYFEMWVKMTALASRTADASNLVVVRK
jgi:hypothetical protein